MIAVGLNEGKEKHPFWSGMKGNYITISWFHRAVWNSLKSSDTRCGTVNVVSSSYASPLMGDSQKSLKRTPKLGAKSIKSIDLSPCCLLKWCHEIAAMLNPVMKSVMNYIMNLFQVHDVDRRS